MPKPQVLAIVNGTGRQAASVITVASAVGYNVRAQVHTLEGVVAAELASLPNVTLFLGPLIDPESAQVNDDMIREIFEGATAAFINTTSQSGDEVTIGKALADAAVRTPTMQHLIYSSMPDHGVYNPTWPSLPLWAAKFAVENYIRSSIPTASLAATFVYAGIYNNNFTSLPFPLFCMELQADGSFEWRAPFHEDVPLPWLDAEHDVGPAVLQILKDGPGKWAGKRLALAFEMLSPNQVCDAFSRALKRSCRYKRTPKIEIRVTIPVGYKEQLEGIERLFGECDAPYYPLPELNFVDDDSDTQDTEVEVDEDEFVEDEKRNTRVAEANYSQHRRHDILDDEDNEGDVAVTDDQTELDYIANHTSRTMSTTSSTSTVRSHSVSKPLPILHHKPGVDPISEPLPVPPVDTSVADDEVAKKKALKIVEPAKRLWEGWRGIEEYASEAFIIEERANGLDWMVET